MKHAIKKIDTNRQTHPRISQTETALEIAKKTKQCMETQ